MTKWTRRQFLKWASFLAASDVRYISAAAKMGLGTMDVSSIKVEEI